MVYTVVPDLLLRSRESWVSPISGFPYDSAVKNLSAMQESQVQSTRKDPLEKKMTTHSSILPWEIPWT